LQTERGRFLVLDGKQRLLTLAQFAGLSDTSNNNFKLRQLDVRQDLERQDFHDLEANSRDITAFLNQTVRAAVIRNWPSVDFLHLVFVRLNTGSVPLSPQELRQAMFPGPFVTFADEWSVESPGLRLLLNEKGADFRMRDLELLVRFFAFTLFYTEYRGDLKHFLDYACSTLNEKWSESSSEIVVHAERFENAVRTAAEIFGAESIGRKWTVNGLETRLNRAVLDVQLYFFADEDVATLSRERSEEVRKAFIDLSVESDTFRRAIESTTKSLEATTTRFMLWQDSLSLALGRTVPFPLRFRL
jgi:hypothetical protein